ncbi:hypothetical protein CKK33_01040 [Mucilaginibacter sp. MD40]|uniref:gliding motility-associated C-terminal domain-containing protein n=1 Tax=Mucilaginibacter sp. MD40 TaxID=2029590 RepID=UPI000BACA5A7|nr:gliding motility-associated C-terminal domain-containing protein [Mucilaginibacter sp. MD40]PAW92154.1 hypothetical protein CKK33_01040 [Mucilaginibacter sp. MD40]
MLPAHKSSSLLFLRYLFKVAVSSGIAALLLLFICQNVFAAKIATTDNHPLNDSTAGKLKRLRAAGNCYDVNWTTWPSQNNINSLTGSIIDADGTPISINMVANYSFGTTPSIYSFSSRLSGYPSAIPNATVPKTEWAAGAGGTTTMCFSRKVTNPVLLLASLGSSAPQSASLDFSTPYVVLYDGGGMVYNSSTKITGTEGYAIIMFPGDFTCVTINSTTPENYTNLTWGIRPQPFNININDGAVTCGSTTVTADGGVSYHWSGGDTPNQPNNTFRTSGVYTVTVTNAAGCVASASKSVTVYEGVPLITGFSVPGQVAPATINQYDKTVEITVADGTDLSALTPQITTSDAVSVIPAINTTQNFNTPVNYTLSNVCANVFYKVTVKTQTVVIPISACPATPVTMAGAEVTPPVSNFLWQREEAGNWVTAEGISNTANYITNAPSNLTGFDIIRNYRRVVNKGGIITYDSYYRLTTNATTAQNVISVDKPVTCGTGIQHIYFTGNVPKGYLGYSSYQWQTSADGMNWQNATNAIAQNWALSIVLSNKLWVRRVTKTGDCEAYSNAVSIDYITGPTTADAGQPVTLCNLSSYTLQGNNPQTGETGTWSVTSASGYNPFNASNIHDPHAVINGLPANTQLNFTWTITKPNCDEASSASVLITNGISSSITGFSVPGQNSPAIIDQTDHTITVSVSPLIDRAHLTPTITTDNGTLIPESGVERDFTSPVNYTLSNVCANVTYKVIVTQIVPEVLNICQDAFNILLPGTDVNGATYQWEKLINGTWQSVGSGGNNSDYIAPISGGSSAIVVESYRRRTIANGIINYQPYINVNINPQINNNTISGNTNVICATGSRNVTISGTTPTGGNGIITYKWRVSADNVNWQILDNTNGKDYQFIFNATTKQYYSRLALSGNCQTASNTVIIDYAGNVTVSTVNVSPLSCGQTQVTLNGKQPGSNEEGTWSLEGPEGYNPFNNENVHNPLVTLNNVPPDVDIKFTWTIAQQICGAFSKGSTSVHINSNPIANAGNDVLIKNGEKTTLNGSVSANSTFFWSPANGLSDPTILNPVASPVETTVYTLTATNAAGCKAFASVKITVDNELQIPNTITPNGDGINDTWVIKNLENHPKASIQIFTRSGTLVYFAKGGSKKWDAIYNGKKLPAAVYYYIITLDDDNAKKTGWVTVIY